MVNQLECVYGVEYLTLTLILVFLFSGKLGKDHPTVAIISSYALDMMWVADHFQEDTSLLLVNRRDESKSPKLSQIVVEAKTTNLFLLYPDISYGAMHVKCAILCYDNYMRVVIPTANFVAYDWDTMDNGKSFSFPTFQS